MSKCFLSKALSVMLVTVLCVGTATLSTQADSIVTDDNPKFADAETAYLKQYSDAEYTDSDKIFSLDSEKVISNEDDLICDINIEKAAIYAIKVGYTTYDDSTEPISLSMKIDGEYPYSEFAEISLPRRFEDTGEKRSDNSGNEISKAIKQVCADFEYVLKNSSNTKELLVYLETGKHTFTISVTDVKLGISSIALVKPSEFETYDEYSANYSGSPKYGKSLVLEAEDTQSKTAVDMVQLSDNSSAAVSPADPKSDKINYIGGGNWSLPGEAISWEITVPEDGLYSLGFNYRQNYTLNTAFYRELRIDGNLPFAEAAELRFPYGDDKEYLEFLRDSYIKKGIDVPLFTSDGTGAENLLDGSIEGCLPTLNFGSRVEDKFRAFNTLFPDKPKMCMEMWNGWFDAWGDEKHHTTSPEDYAQVVEDMLKIGSLNMYMFIGGTNFGFTSGANHYEKFAPDVTSYDYDAILTECGDITPKYLAVRKVIQKYTDEPLPEIPANREKKAYGKFKLNEKVGFFASLDNLSSPIQSDVPRCMEEYGTGYGYIAYRTVLNRDYSDAVLSFESLGDRAQIYINDTLGGIVYINDSLEITVSAKKGDVLTVLCENMGRANFGPKMMRKKGIAGRCLLNGKIHFNWTVYPLPMDNLNSLKFSEGGLSEKSAFYRGYIEIDKPFDTFLKLENFTKGFVTVNGFNIGRYWEIGPQKTLYVPRSLLKKGQNEFIVFESDGLKGEPIADLTDKPELVYIH